MMEKNKGIKTVKDGRVYRSRLEAKWASFFDILGWKYEYEPIDLPGWIPDFMIYGHKPILVEVKPIITFEDDSELARELTKANTTGYEILVLGLSILDCEGNAQLGWLQDPVFWDQAVLGIFGMSNKKKIQEYGFMGLYGSYEDRISGYYDGNGHIRKIYTYEEILPVWNEACNRVQWHKI